MQFKLQIIKYSVLSYRPNFTLHKKTTKLYKIFIQTNSPIFAAKLQNNILIFQRTGFFCFYSRVFRININKAQMTKGSSRVFSREEAKISKRSSYLLVLEPDIIYRSMDFVPGFWSDIQL